MVLAPTLSRQHPAAAARMVVVVPTGGLGERRWNVFLRGMFAGWAGARSWCRWSDEIPSRRRGRGGIRCCWPCAVDGRPGTAPRRAVVCTLFSSFSRAQLWLVAHSMERRRHRRVQGGRWILAAEAVAYRGFRVRRVEARARRVCAWRESRRGLGRRPVLQSGPWWW